MALHPDLEAEQDYLDFAYKCLEDARSRASSLESMVEVGAGGTEQARFERDVIWDTILTRLRELDLGDASLVFGRVTTEIPLILESRMAENGVIFSDGIEKDFLEFNSGTQAVIGVAERKGVLVT